jgi:hypothetical protein
MEWITLFFWSVMMCFPFYIIGTVVVGVVWYFTRRRHIFPKILIRSFSLALLLAPGVAIGHGIAAIPAVVAVIADLVDHRPDLELQGFSPILFVWVVSAVILSAIAHFSSKKQDDTAA